MASSFNTNQVSVASSATLIVGQNTGRKAVVITNTSTTALYISSGTNAAAGPNCTTSAGQLLPGVVGASISIPSTSAVWGISGGSSATVTFLDA